MEGVDKQLIAGMKPKKIYEVKKRTKERKDFMKFNFLFFKIDRTMGNLISKIATETKTNNIIGILNKIYLLLLYLVLLLLLLYYYLLYNLFIKILLFLKYIGGGKGHLSRFLALQYGMNITSMDCNASSIFTIIYIYNNNFIIILNFFFLPIVIYQESKWKNEGR